MKVAIQSSQYLFNDKHKKIADISNRKQEKDYFKYCLLHALVLVTSFFILHGSPGIKIMGPYYINSCGGNTNFGGGTHCPHLKETLPGYIDVYTF